MQTRAKGLIGVHEVKKILESEGHKVDGPYWKAIWAKGKMQVIHKDLYNIADILSFYRGSFYLHQVTDLRNKSYHVRSIKEIGLPCFVWCRVKEGRKIQYRVFIVGLNGGMVEDTPRWKVSNIGKVEVK